MSNSENLDGLRSEGDINLSPARKAWTDAHIGADTADWLARDEAVFLRQALSTPCLNVLKGAEGPRIEDWEGREYLDFHGNNVHQAGFAHPKVVEAITRQMASLSFCTRRYTNVPAILLAERLAALAPGDLGKVLFAPGGTAAIGMALKLARAASGRFKTISMWDAFHGASLDAISIGGEAIFRKNAGPLLPGCEHVPPPDPTGCPFKCGKTCSLQCADYVEYVLEKEGDVAAVVAETVRSTPFIPPQDYWQRIRAACDRHGALLILDEIPTCLGRTGHIYAFEHYGIVPDMVVLGKGLGGGIFPLAALVARKGLDVAAAGAIGHYTHEKNPVACAAALASLDVLLEDGVLDHARRLGHYALERLAELQKKYPLIGAVRGLGLLLGVELIVPETGQRAIAQAEQVMYEALSRGLNFKVSMGNILCLTPALIITKAELDAAIAILDASLAVVSAQ